MLCPLHRPPLSRLLCLSPPLPFCLHARLLPIVGQISDASIRLSASTTAQSAIGFTSWLTVATLAHSCLSDEPTLPFRLLLTSSFLPSPLPVSSAVLLSSCLLTADCRPHSDASISLSASTTAQFVISFTSWLTVATLAHSRLSDEPALPFRLLLPSLWFPPYITKNTNCIPVQNCGFYEVLKVS